MSSDEPKHKKIIAHLHKRASESKASFEKRFPRASKKLKSVNLDISDLRRHSAKMLSAAAIAGGVLFGSPAIKEHAHPTYQDMTLSKEQVDQQVKENLGHILPKKVGPLSPETEEKVSDVFRKTLGINAVARLDGNRLNDSYGYIGGEQHMPRYPGDSLAQHDELQVKGITAHRGAFGYFGATKDQMTQEAVMQEKYYVAVQTLYLPNWNTNHKTLKEWYKFRKVLVVNPTTGKSIVAVIGDAGPAAWTGKQFGGSPEVMDYLRPWENKNKGAVLLFFVDDRENPIALGPVEGRPQTFIAKK